MNVIIFDHAANSGKGGSIVPKLIENLKEKLMEEAKKQLMEVGYEAMMISSLAKACGVGV